VVALTLGLCWAGWEQGRLLNDAGVPFADVTRALGPWLAFRSLGLVVLLAGHAAFAINFFWLACPINSRGTAPAEIRQPPAMEGVKA